MVELVEGEHDVINLKKIEGAMAASVQALKHEYATSVTARITPGGWVGGESPAAVTICPHIRIPASLDSVSVEIEGQSYPLKQVAQLGMPNPQTILINMSAYPEVTFSWGMNIPGWAHCVNICSP